MTELKKLHNGEKLQYFQAAQKYRNSYEWKDLLNRMYKPSEDKSISEAELILHFSEKM